MPVKDGSYQLGPEHGRLLLHTAREGVASRAGHDLVIEVSEWSGKLVITGAESAWCTVEVSARAEPLQILEGHGGVKPLTDGDRHEIQKTARTKVLHSDRYPEISFRSTTVSGTPDEFTIDGELTLHGQTHPLQLRGAIADTDAGPHAKGRATIRQSQWGVTPYKGFFGALKVADDVGLEFDVTLTASAPTPQ